MLFAPSRINLDKGEDSPTTKKESKAKVALMLKSWITFLRKIVVDKAHKATAMHGNGLLAGNTKRNGIANTV